MDVEEIGQTLTEAAGALDYDGAARAVDRLLQKYDGGAPLPDAASSKLEHRRALVDQLVRAQPIEHLVVLDAAGCVRLYLRGEISRVALPSHGGQIDPAVAERLWRAPCVLHNHPVGHERPIGGTFSLSDIELAERFQISEMRVAALEATYSLAPARETSWHAGWISTTARTYARMRASMDDAMENALGSSVQRDVYFFLRTFDFLMLQMAKRLHMTYRRIDQPVVDWSTQVPSIQSLSPVHEGRALIDDGPHFHWLSGQLCKIL